MLRLAVFGALVCAAAAEGAASNGLGDAYTWVPFAEATAVAKEKNKPIMMVVTKTWCGACKALKPAFASSSDILTLSSNFVLTNVADDDEPKDSKYAPDGGYIPRVLFLNTQGEVLDVTNVEGNARYKYYYAAPAQIMTAMTTALSKFSDATGTGATDASEAREEL